MLKKLAARLVTLLGACAELPAHCKGGFWGHGPKIATTPGLMLPASRMR